MYKLILAMEGEGGKLRAYTLPCRHYRDVEAVLYEAQLDECDEDYDGVFIFEVDVIDEDGREYTDMAPDLISETYAGYALFEGGIFVESDIPDDDVRDFLDKYFHIGADDEDFD